MNLLLVNHTIGYTIEHVYKQACTVNTTSHNFHIVPWPNILLIIFTSQCFPLTMLADRFQWCLLNWSNGLPMYTLCVLPVPEWVFSSLFLKFKGCSVFLERISTSKVRLIFFFLKKKKVKLNHRQSWTVSYYEFDIKWKKVKCMKDCHQTWDRQ